jgi:glycosylphosphatidylinositol transamidase (GPIT) subunit GPI8
MYTTLDKLKKYFPAVPPNAIAKIYHARCERLRLLMNHGIPEDICWMIEAKVRLSGESSNSFISYMPGTGKNTFTKKRRAKTAESLSQMCQMDL